MDTKAKQHSQEARSCEEAQSAFSNKYKKMGALYKNFSIMISPLFRSKSLGCLLLHIVGSKVAVSAPAVYHILP
jgi:hypothetical protein